MNLGLYIHIPFCQAKCNYCHFISFPYRREMASRYKKAVLREIECSLINKKDDAEVNTVYFGGGTPSLVPASHIAAFLEACRSKFRMQPDCEVSIEANPGTLSEKKINVYLKSGVNRISVGAQSFVDRELSAIGRLHDSKLVCDALQQLRRSGFKNISMDLMLGLPFQTKASWKDSLEMFIQQQIPHVSVYMLDLDEECLLSRLVANETVGVPGEDLIADMYLETLDFLSSYGYKQYEISNFAQPGYECRHNLKYWMRDSVHGFGLGSHSFDGISRYSNISSFSDYVRAIETGLGPSNWQEKIGDAQALQESLFLGLRLAEGIDVGKLCGKFGTDALSQYADYFHDLIDRGLAEGADQRFRLTTSGMLLSNEIFQRFV